MDSLKTANAARQEQARLEVENAEDDLVQKTEVAITLMKTVLENVGSLLPLLTNVNSLFVARAPQESERAGKSSTHLLFHCRRIPFYHPG